MSDEEGYKFFQLRKQAKTYISKVFSYNSFNSELHRNITMVLDGSDEIRLGEIKGSMCLRLTGEKRKTQVVVVVTQDDKKVQRITLETYQARKGDWYQAPEKFAFTFRSGEFERLNSFLSYIKFTNLTNQSNFQIEDISTGTGSKVLIDAADRGIVERIKEMTAEKRNILLSEMHSSLTREDLNVLLGRKQGLADYENQLKALDWNEKQWQDFFEREDWVFGYGLDYRIMRQFSREATVGSGGSENQHKPAVDFLMNFTDYTVLVEIKRPDTPLFKAKRNGRAGTWDFSSEFIGAISQVLEQKVKWSSFAQTGTHYSKQDAEILSARTKNAKSILVIGSHKEFEQSENQRDANIKRDTFELFRRENRSIDIVTFDELLERAKFITRNV